jgi:cation transporter-like permease
MTSTIKATVRLLLHPGRCLRRVKNFNEAVPVLSVVLPDLLSSGGIGARRLSAALASLGLSGFGLPSLLLCAAVLLATSAFGRRLRLLLLLLGLFLVHHGCFWSWNLASFFSSWYLLIG